MAELLKGAPAAKAIIEDLIPRVEKLTAAGVVPTLAIVRLGEEGSQLSYQRNATRKCESIGARVLSFDLPESSSQEELLALIESINTRRDIHGCLILRPLPGHIDERAVCEALAPEKDLDCATALSLAAVFSGRGAGYPPCTAQACLEMLDHYQVDVAGKHVVVVGRSLVVGRPVSLLLQARNATVTMCHSRSVGLPELCRRADVLVVAAGKAGLIGAEHLSPGQTVIDVGINVVGDKLCGDVRFEEAEGIVAAVSPVPGGVGAVTTAVLAKHLVQAAEAGL